MKKLKISFSKNSLLLILILCVAFSCQKELGLGSYDELSVVESDANSIGNLKQGKIDVCHYSIDDDSWHMISINENAWEAHSRHGDVRLDDQDMDGFVPDNECGFGEMGDCDDNNGLSFPEAFPIQTWYLVADDDEDGWSVILDQVTGTCQPSGYIDVNEAITFQYTDCNDADPDVYPGAPEICDGIDNNCNGFDYDISIDIEFQGTPFLATYADFGNTEEGTYSGEWVNSPDPRACGDLEPAQEKIMLIDRGVCPSGIGFFDVKISKAEAAGAIAVIICNFENSSLVTMGASETVAEPGIPAIMLSYEDCQTIRLGDVANIEFSRIHTCIEPGLRSANKASIHQEFNVKSTGLPNMNQLEITK